MIAKYYQLVFYTLFAAARRFNGMKERRSGLLDTCFLTMYLLWIWVLIFSMPFMRFLLLKYGHLSFGKDFIYIFSLFLITVPVYLANYFWLNRNNLYGEVINYYDAQGVGYKRNLVILLVLILVYGIIGWYIIEVLKWGVF